MKLFRVIIILCFFLYLPSTLTLGEEAFDITQEYGPKLDQVSFKERFLFKKTMSLDWYKSTLEQRRDFLEKYYQDQQDEKERKALRDKKYAEKEKERARLKRDKLRKEKAAAKAELARLKVEEREEEIYKKDKERKHKLLIKQIETQRKAERSH